MNEPILSVQNLTTQLQINRKNYPVVDNLSFNLYPGKTLALVGESGCGKSMTALSVLRILPHPPALKSTGKILYREQNLLDLPEHKMREIRGSRISMIFQDPSSALNPVFTIGEQLMEITELHPTLFQDDPKKSAIKALGDTGIPSPESRFNDYPHQLSGGMKQRVVIAMALMCEPDILIADEPTTALDVTIQAQILELIKNLQKKNGMAVLLITHDMGVVAEVADDVIVMYASQKVEEAPVLGLFNNMSHPYTQGLFSARSDSFARSGQKLQTIRGNVPPLTYYPKGCRFHPRCDYCMHKCKIHDVPNFLIDEGTRHSAKCFLWDGSEESEQKREEK